MAKHNDRISNPYFKETGFDVKESYTKKELLQFLEYKHGQHLACLFLSEFEHIHLTEKITRYENEHSKSLELLIENEAQKYQLELLNEQVRKADIAKSDFLANMSHEIRTPLNGIIGFTDLLQDSNLDNDQIVFLDMIKKSSVVLLSLINDILDFSKIEAGDIILEQTEFDIETVAFDVCDVTVMKMEDKLIDIICDIQDDIPLNLIGDPLRFEQVLTNLMSNAVKFTDSGEIALSIRREEEESERIKIFASVRDTGIGIPPEKLSILFHPFQQADSSISRKFGGTGLGLSISKRLTDLMGGDIRVESQPDKGSTFYFSAWLGKPEKSIIKEYHSTLCSNKKALIIENNKTSLNILSRMLKKFRISVTATGQGDDALKLLEKANAEGKPFDFCFLNIHLHESSGYEIASKIRQALPPINRIPLIAISSLVKYNSKKYNESGFNTFLSKPIRREMLFNILERFSNHAAECPGEISTSVPVSLQKPMDDPPKKQLHILLAEDDLTSQKLSSIFLKKAGFCITLASNGQEAVEKYISSPGKFDLILMDVQMPVIDGLEATKRIRKAGHAKIPIIAMTAHVMEGLKETFIEAGMNDYISKPVTPESIFQTMRQVLNPDPTSDNSG